MADLRSTIFSALTGRSADVSGKADGDLHGMLMAVGGASTKTKSGIDLTRAAKALGVSRRTVERWAVTAKTGAGQRPSAQHSKTLSTKARQAATTKAGRKAAMARSNLRKQVTSRGARVTITGDQGPIIGADYRRRRSTTLDLDPDQAAAMMDAFEEGGEKGFMSWANDFWGEEYVSDWSFSTEPGGIDGIDIEPPGRGSW
ncbi:hypothetical protein Xcel_3410 (plasmid) [Xylanimonas cellulosilytica DSM 15894]|uniref:Uncharacterized protein n=1 Tax=Xylanimonas cellulosilytica (strain DSM 15894 / JCM 12276 / CECT 5975 / KCTC 9989 / LMG 20990 / NBRC 107835 / XIL07) TaxID=446471 RepID=D1C0U3_XYLCX|nr:hypothetical protein [Xylanimonas cellulosilytica]ACZ32409.1 hypothetical protein Xcel_3410 [Xylanimonas cellulosilytica DSM 15894]